MPPLQRRHFARFEPHKPVVQTHEEEINPLRRSENERHVESDETGIPECHEGRCLEEQVAGDPGPCAFRAVRPAMYSEIGIPRNAPPALEANARARTDTGLYDWYECRLTLPRAPAC